MSVQFRSETLDWDDLRVFLELARCGSLSGAARALRLSHATVGRRLAALEQALGQTLVERRAEGYVLSPDGEAVRAMAEEMDERAQALRRRAGRAEGLTGTVRLTMTEALADRFLLPRLGPLRATHPGLDLEIVTDNRALSLARREADIAIRLARPQGGDLVTRRLCALGYALYAAPAAAPDSVIAYDETMAELPEALWMARHMAGRRVALRTNSLTAQIAAAVTGFGVALLPCVFAAGEPGLRRLPSPVPPPVREAWLLVHRDRKDIPRVRAVIDAVTRVFEEESILLAGGDAA